SSLLRSAGAVPPVGPGVFWDFGCPGATSAAGPAQRCRTPNRETKGVGNSAAGVPDPRLRTTAPPQPLPAGLGPPAFNRQLVARCFRAVADEQPPVGHDRVVPRLALERLEPAELPVPVGARLDQRGLPLFREHQQQVLVRQQQDLAVVVAALLPKPLA